MAEAQRDEIAKLEALYAANPEGRVFTHLAEAYRKAGNLERAREILDAGLSRHPDSATAYVVLGRVAFDSNSHEEARSAFGRALELDEGNLVAHRYLGELALATGDRGAALEHYSELLARNPLDESLLVRVRELSTPVEPAAPADAELAPGDAPELAAASESEAPAQVEDADVAAGGEPAADVPWYDAPPAGAAAAPAPAAGEEPFDASALPGDLAGLAGGQTRAAWEETEAAPDEAFDLEAEAEPLPPLELEALETDALETEAPAAGTSAEPWSWEEPPAAEEEPPYLELEALPQLEGVEPLPELDAEGTGTEPDWFAPAAELPELELTEAAEPESEPESESESSPESATLEPAPWDDAPAAEPAPAAEWAAPDQGEALAPPPAPVGDAVPGVVVTETMAELYRSQGFPDRAADVYRSLLLRSPGDERLQARLREAEAALAAQVQVEEEWPGAADSAFTGGSAAQDVGATPYAWDQAPEEPAPAGPAIRSYFESLLGWRAPRAEPEAAAAAPEPEPAPEVEPEAEATGESAGWEAPGAVAGWESPAVEPAPWELPESVGEAPAAEAPAPWEVEEEPELLLEEPASEAEMFTGWTPDMLLDEPAAAAPGADAPELMPWEVPEPPSLAGPVEPLPAPVENEAPAPSEAPALPQPAAPQPEVEEEDEDLEMFRSWLQSLKK